MSKENLTVVVKTIEAGKPTVNGNVYSLELLEGAIEEFNKKKYRFVTVGSDCKLRLLNVVGQVDMSMDKDKVIVDIELYPKLEKAVGLEKLIRDGALTITPCGRGLIGKNGNIKEFSIDYVSIHPSEPAKKGN